MAMGQGSTRPFSVRRATPADAGAIAAIYNRAIQERVATFETELRDEASMTEWLAAHDARHPVLVAVRPQGGVVGWASVSVCRPGECYAGVGEFSVYVDAAHRGAGLGKGLLTALIDEAARLGYWKLVSRIFPSTRRAASSADGAGFGRWACTRSTVGSTGRGSTPSSWSG